MDGSGFRLGTPPRYGWARKGQKFYAKSVCGKWGTVTRIGAIALDGFRGFMTVNAGTGNDAFHAFVEHERVPNLKQGDIVVMDNLSAHNHEQAIKRIHDAGAHALFTPPYSPQFNPIEKAWAKLKDIVRRAHTLTRRLRARLSPKPSK